MDIFLALILLIVVVYFVHSLFWAVIYILAACLLVWAFRNTNRKRL